METVFDHNITDEEWEFIGAIDKELYLSCVDADSANQDIAFLYYNRGNNAMYERYLKKLPLEIRQQVIRTTSHP